MNIDPNNINSTNKSGVHSTTKSGVQPSKQSSQASTQSSPDSVSLSNKAKALGELELAAKNSPDVNEAHVSAIKAAIDDGSYTVDVDRLASNMLNQDDSYQLT